MVNAPLDKTTTVISENLAVDAKNGDAVNTTIAIFTTKELTKEEEGDSEALRRNRFRLERQVERAFSEAGKALRQLRDRKLYRNSHKTFDEYCKDRFSYNRSRSYQLIDAASVVDNLEECPQIVDILPTAEGQVRPLTKLEAEEQVRCWQEAVEAAGGKVPSGRIVKSIVDKLQEQTNLPNTHYLGQVCEILPKDDLELKGKNGCWGIITHVGNFSYTIITWDGEYLVKMENLKPLDYSESDSQYMQQLCQRLVRLHRMRNIDDAVIWLLAGLSKRYQPCLTPLQEKLLTIAEEECGLI
jgi:hypothetical protein